MQLWKCFPRRNSLPLSEEELATEDTTPQETGEDQVSQEIDIKMKEEKEFGSKAINILLLGPGGSGKTTAVKQILKLHKNPDDEKEAFDPIQCLESIHKMIFYDLMELCNYNMKERTNNMSFEIEDEECRRLVDSFAKDNSMFFQKVIIRKALAEKMEKIWACTGIKNAFESYRMRNVLDNTPYFLDQIERLYVDGDQKSTKIVRDDIRYTPSWDDYVRIRDQTTGVLTYTVTTSIQDKKWMFRLTDVGGQKSERKKWVNVFHDVGVVFFVMSLSGYDQTSYDDARINCYDETFDVFRQVVSNTAFQHTDFFLFMNKVDLFRAKINSVPFTVYDKSFDESSKHNETEVVKYVEKKLKTIWWECPEQWQEKRTLFFHLTCSLDTEMMRSTIGSVQSVLVKQKMRSASII